MGSKEEANEKEFPNLIQAPPRSYKTTKTASKVCMDIVEKDNTDKGMLLMRTREPLYQFLEDTYPNHVKYSDEVQGILHVSDEEICPNFPQDDRPFIIRSLEHKLTCQNKGLHNKDEIPDSFLRKRRNINLTKDKLKELASDGWSPSAVVEKMMRWNEKNDEPYFLCSTYAKAKKKLIDYENLPDDTTQLILDESRNAGIMTIIWTEDYSDEDFDVDSPTPTILLEHIIQKLKKLNVRQLKEFESREPQELDDIELTLESTVRHLKDIKHPVEMAYRFRGYEFENFYHQDSLMEPLSKEEYVNWFHGMMEDYEHHNFKHFPEDPHKLKMLRAKINAEHPESPMSIWSHINKQISEHDFNHASQASQHIINSLEKLVEEGKADDITQEAFMVYKFVKFAVQLNEDDQNIFVRLARNNDDDHTLGLEIMKANKDGYRSKEAIQNLVEDAHKTHFVDATPPVTEERIDLKELVWGISDKDLNYIGFKENESFYDVNVIAEGAGSYTQEIYNPDTRQKALDDIAEKVKQMPDSTAIYCRSKKEMRLMNQHRELGKYPKYVMRGKYGEGVEIREKHVFITGIPRANIFADRNRIWELMNHANINNYDEAIQILNMYNALQELLQCAFRTAGKEGETVVFLNGVSNKDVERIKKMYDWTSKINWNQLSPSGNRMTIEQKKAKLNLMVTNIVNSREWDMRDGNDYTRIFQRRLDEKPEHAHTMAKLYRDGPISKTVMVDWMTNKFGMTGETARGLLDDWIQDDYFNQKKEVVNEGGGKAKPPRSKQMVDIRERNKVWKYRDKLWED